MKRRQFLDISLKSTAFVALGGCGLNIKDTDEDNWRKAWMNKRTGEKVWHFDRTWNMVIFP